MTHSPPASWAVPTRTIAIATLQRSGSNLLGELMEQTGRLGRPAEYFNPDVVHSRFPGQGRTVVDHCRLAREHGASENDVVGIKFFPEHFASLAGEVRFSEWFGTPLWVRLTRRDVLGQAISLVLARQLNVYRSGDAPTREPMFSAVHISETIDRLCARDARWTAYFTRTGLKPLEIAYEDIEADAGGVVEKIAEAAQIDLGGRRAVAPLAHHRQRTVLNQEWRARFIEELGDPDVFSVPWRRIRGWLGEMLLRKSAARHRE